MEKLYAIVDTDKSNTGHGPCWVADGERGLVLHRAPRASLQTVWPHQKKNQQLYIRDRKSAENCYVTEAPDGNSVMQKP